MKVAALLSATTFIIEKKKNSTFTVPVNNIASKHCIQIN